MTTLRLGAAARLGAVSALLTAASGFSACAASHSVICSTDKPTAAGDHVCAVPGWDDRDYILHLPAGYDPARAWPVLVLIHGGAGRKELTNQMTCRDGDTASASCMNALADRQGFVVVAPDGSAGPIFHDVRTFNAGGGKDGYHCVSGKACQNGVDDSTYFRNLLDELPKVVNVDPRRVYAAGHSNGGAMTNRVACEFTDRVAAIAAVASGNQVAAVQGCHPTRAIPVLHIHGTGDPCWPFEGGDDRCFDPDDGTMVSVADTILGTDARPGWVRRNGCNLTPAEEAMPDTASDGLTARRQRFSGCRDGADVQLIIVDGGGHAWPDGYQAPPRKMKGPMPKDFNANEEIWNFLSAHTLP